MVAAAVHAPRYKAGHDADHHIRKTRTRISLKQISLSVENREWTDEERQNLREKGFMHATRELMDDVALTAF